MKNLYAFSLALIFVFPAQAGNWDLFPLGQSSWYALSGSGQVNVDLCLMDSMRTEGDLTIYYSKRKFHEQLFGAWADSINAQVWANPQNFPYGGNPYHMDSLVQHGDTVFFHSGFSTIPFFFLPKASVGDSWTVNSTFAGNSYNQITITCTQIEEQSFLGITDSVKVFALEPNGDFQIRLSKTHGLIEFPPLVLFHYHPPWQEFIRYEMIGVQTTGTGHGYQQPGFSDYFHLSPGDVLLWQHSYHGWITEPSVLEFMRDSITNTTITADSVTYVFDRTWLHTDHSITYHPGLSRTYRKADWRGLLEASPNDWGIQGPIGPDPPYIDQVWRTDFLALITPPTVSDTITEFLVYSDPEMADFGESYVFDTRVGFKEHYLWMNPSQDQTVLVASRVNGVVDGDITLAINDPRSISQQPFTLVPNPAKESISFQGLPRGATGQFTIYDGLGREAMHGTLPTAALSVESLQPGVYVVHVCFSDRTEMARFVKE